MNGWMDGRIGGGNAGCMVGWRDGYLAVLMALCFFHNRGFSSTYMTLFCRLKKKHDLLLPNSGRNLLKSSEK